MENPSSVLYGVVEPILYSKEFLTCKILMLPSKPYKTPFAWAFQKHSPYLQLFNYHLQIMDEIGTLKKLLQKYKPPPQICLEKAGRPISFESCVTAFLALSGRYKISEFAKKLNHTNIHQ